MINVLGTTETGLPPCWLPAKEDWQYLHYNSAFKGIQLREVQDRLYQQFLVRDPSTDPYHGTWSTFPDFQEYTMNDLYAKHPTKQDLWLYVGRADDVIVLSNGEKLNPTSMELTIVGHLGVTGALVIGQARFAPAIIIELEDELAKKVEVREEREAQINAIWPYIIEANKSAPSHAQLSRDKIIFSKPEKAFVRAPKGTVIRTATTKLYEREIEELYQDIHKEDLENVPHIDLTKDSSEIEAILGNLVGTAVGVESLSPEQDFFASGMDSLQVMKIARQLEAALDGKYRADTISRMIYSNATVATLAAALKDTSGTRPSVSGEAAMLQTLERFTKQLPPKNAKQLQPKTLDGLVVILTGSTGSLGSYLLDTLATSKNVKKIYCLNRRADADQQQAKTNAARGLVSEWGNKVVFLHTDLSRPSLGLNQKDYGRLRNEACVIIRKCIHTSYVEFMLITFSFASRQPMACQLQSRTPIIRATHRRGAESHQTLIRVTTPSPNFLHIFNRHPRQLGFRTPWNSCSRDCTRKPVNLNGARIQRVEMGYRETSRCRQGPVRCIQRSFKNRSNCRSSECGRGEVWDVE